MVVAGVTSSKHDVHIPGYFRGSRGRYSPCWYGGGGSGSGGGGGGGGGDGNRKDDVEYTPTPPPSRRGPCVFQVCEARQSVHTRTASSISFKEDICFRSCMIYQVSTYICMYVPRVVGWDGTGVNDLYQVRSKKHVS